MDSIDKFILIGGPSRSGTNTIGAFLNLHEDVRGYADANHIQLGPDLIAQLDKQGIRQYAICTHSGFEDYLSHKNDEDRSPRIVVLRLDYAETRPFELIRESLDMTVGLIYAVRADLFAVLCSQAWRGMFNQKGWGNKPITRGDLRRFIRRILESFDAIKRLKSEYPGDVLIVDITNQFKARQYYEDILAFEGLSANQQQEKWMRLLPISNAGDRSGKIVQEEYREWTEKHRYLDDELSILREHEIYRCMS